MVFEIHTREKKFSLKIVSWFYVFNGIHQFIRAKTQTFFPLRFTT